MVFESDAGPLVLAQLDEVASLCRAAQVNLYLSKACAATQLWTRMYDAQWFSRLWLTAPPTRDDFRKRFLAMREFGEILNTVPSRWPVPPIPVSEPTEETYTFAIHISRPRSDPPAPVYVPGGSQCTPEYREWHNSVPQQHQFDGICTVTVGGFGGVPVLRLQNKATDTTCSNGNKGNHLRRDAYACTDHHRGTIMILRHSDKAVACLSDCGPQDVDGHVGYVDEEERGGVDGYEGSMRFEAEGYNIYSTVLGEWRALHDTYFDFLVYVDVEWFPGSETMLPHYEVLDAEIEPRIYHHHESRNEYVMSTSKQLHSAMETASINWVK